MSAVLVLDDSRAYLPLRVASDPAPQVHDFPELPQFPPALDGMSPALDELSLQFAIHTRASVRESLDVGCGEGLATVAALARGGRVVAVDPEPRSLQRLMTRVPAAQHPRLRAQAGRLPDIDFKNANFTAVHAARVLHHLDGAAVERSFRKFFRWLYPQGRLFLSALTPLGDGWKPFHAEFIRKSAAGARWPGYIDDASRYFAPCDRGPTAVHLFNERILRHELEAVGFTIKKASYYPLPWDSEQICCAIIARCDPHTRVSL
jgi:SAM-dependent methyltransferase